MKVIPNSAAGRKLLAQEAELRMQHEQAQDVFHRAKQELETSHDRYRQAQRDLMLATVRMVHGAAPGHLGPRGSRAVEVLELLLEGKRDKEIAAALNISLRTAKFHVSNVLARHGVSSRVQLLAQFRGHERASPAAECTASLADAELTRC
jgi:DNA-binding NarL/FixJ family response regulator